MIRLVVLSLVLVGVGMACIQPQDAEHLGVVPAERVVPAVGEVPASGADTTPPGLVDFPRFPSISPDGSWIVFTWRGDLWKVSAQGGHAERLTTHPSNDEVSAWSRDGTRIAFSSNRTGYDNIHLMRADGTDVHQVTNEDQGHHLTGFGVDEAGHEVVTFAAFREGDNYAAPRPYMCATTGGDIVRLHDAFGRNPKISPDGGKVLFTRGGSRWSRRHYRGPDARAVWLYDRADKTFTRLTHWEGNDARACWLGDDTALFLSDRELDCVNVYRMDADKGDRRARRLTDFNEDDVQELDVSLDGSTAVFMVWDTLYTLKLTEPGAQPMALTITANEDENDNFELKSINREVDEAALSPDGKVMAFAAYGEVYVRNLEEKSPTRRVTHSPARERQLAWSPDGLKLYFVSDRDGTESIYAATVTLTRKEVKEEFEKALKPPEEKEKEEDKKAEEPEAEADEPKPEAPAEPVKEEGAEEDKPGPTEKEAVTAEEEDDDEGDSKQKDKKKKDKKKEEEELPKELRPERWHDALKFKIEPVVQTAENEREPNPSPDGKYLAFRRSRGDLMLLDLESGETRCLVEGWDPGLEVCWSPDSRHLAYAHNDLDFNSDIWIMPADGSQPAVNVTRHPDNEYSPRWSADGKILAFISERVEEEYDVWAVYLDKDLEVLTPKELEKYYEDAAKAAKKRKPLKVKKPKSEEPKEEPQAEPKEEPQASGAGEDQPAAGAPKAAAEDEEAEEDEGEKKKDEDAEDEDEDEDKEEKKKEEPKKLDLDDAYLRLRRITRLAGNEGNLELTPGGELFIFTAENPSRGLYTVKWDGDDQNKLCDSVSVQGVSLTGDKIVVVSHSRGGTIGPKGKKIEYVDISDRIRIDLQEQASQKFKEMARTVGEMFYHPTLKGLDWPALTEKYHALARQTRTGSEFNHVGMRLLGELNGSHLGVYSRDPRSPNAQAQGRLGTVHHRVKGGYEVTQIVPESPAAKGEMALQVGDVITAVELEPFGPTETLETRLAGREGEETLFSIRRALEDERVIEVDLLLTPISVGALRGLQYRAWRRERAERVSELSDGRLGYIHIEGMGQHQLDIFERDLYAAAGDKDGLIIDVRNNGGGWTADRLLASIMVQPHAYTMPRGADPNEVGHYPQDRLFIQRYTLPANMLCNEKSFSNAEIIAHAFKTLKRGTLVGQQTYGGVISTGATRLIDGTLVRLPFRGWFVIDGTDMENHGAVPHLVVDQTPEAESRCEDEQLKAAVDDLLKRLK